MNALRLKLGFLETEKFISLILKESFDYTEWQKDLWVDKSVQDIQKSAEQLYLSKHIKN
jgi:hypothetical protein